MPRRRRDRGIQFSNPMMFNSLQKEVDRVNTGDNESFDLIGLTELRNNTDFANLDGSSLSVAVIDSGIDTAHPLLQNNYTTGFDFFNGDDHPDDVVGHGTHVSGIIGAGDRRIGVAPDVDLIGLKVGEARQVDSNAIADSLEWVLNNHQQYNIVAVNMSLSGGFYTSEDWLVGDRKIDLIQRLEEAGIVVVSAAGNDYQYRDSEGSQPNQEPNLGAPAIYSTIAVGAVWQNDNPPFHYAGTNQTAGTDRIAYFSQRLDTNNFILAPGTYVNSTYADNDGLELLSGTSMASPHVAGAVALLQEAALQFGGRLLTPDEVTAILQNTADTVFDGDDEEDVVTNTNTSYSRLNIYNAVAQVQRRFADTKLTAADRDRNGTINQVRQSASYAIFSSQENIGEDRDVYVGDRDVDFWKISFDESGILEIEVDASDVDTVATLFDREGNLLAVNDDSDGLNPLLRYEIIPDTDYYLSITGYGNEFAPFALGSGSVGDTGDYRIGSDLLPLSQIDNVSNNSINTGELKDVEVGTTIQGNIGADNGLVLGADDIDLYRFVAPQDGELNINVRATEEFGSDTVLRLFDRDGDEIASNNNENNTTKDSYLQQEITANTKYYIGINGYSDRAWAYDPLTGENAATGIEGDYSLSLDYEGDINSLDSKIYRFQNKAIPGTYIYVGERERQNITENFSNFHEEGKAFKVATEPENNLIPIYRFQNNNIPGTYLFVGETERNNINNNFQNTLSEEGLAFYVYGADDSQGTTLYRFGNTSQPGTYIFVAEAERANIINNYPSFVEEGAAFEVNI